MTKDKQKNITWQSIVLMQGSALIFSLANIFSKYAAREEGLTLQFVFFYGISLFIMMFYAVLWQQILKRVSMTVAYSNRLVAMIWGIIWGKILFDEQITLQVIIGTVVILAGLYIMVNADE